MTLPTLTNSRIIAPNGSSTGAGTLTSPLSLKAALTSAQARPGDVFMLRAGEYKLGYCEVTISGEVNAPITFMAAPGERAIIDGYIVPFSIKGNLVFDGLELMHSFSTRISTASGWKFDGAQYLHGFAVYAPHIRIINCFIHDIHGQGICFNPEAKGCEAYGNVVLNCGIQNADRTDGHGFYIKSVSDAADPTIISDNFSLNGMANGFQLYTDGTEEFFQNMIVEGNVACGAGVLSTLARPMRDFLVGVDSPKVVKGFKVNGNVVWVPTNARNTSPEAQIGRASTLKGFVGDGMELSRNIFMGGMTFSNWKNAVVSGNTIVANNGKVVNADQSNVDAPVTWNNNGYYAMATTNGYPFTLKRVAQPVANISFANWKKVTGYDAASVFGQGKLVFSG